MTDDPLRILRTNAQQATEPVPEYDALCSHVPPLAHRTRCGSEWRYQITLDGVEWLALDGRNEGE